MKKEALGSSPGFTGIDFQLVISNGVPIASDAVFKLDH
jgi:hypothetical protein